ncbi:MAG: DMT family transporter [Flavobacteriaceae bacterium]|nr:DMT family transporter [Flavobacteriaceae bacterium]
MKNTYKAHVALLSANLIYGANYLIAKGVMPNKIGPSAFVFLRILGAGILFWIIKQFIKEKVDKKDFKLLALCGLLGVTANQLLFFNGLNLTSPIDASIIITAIPIVVLVVSVFMLKEKLTQFKITGIVLGSLGAILLITYGNNTQSTSSVLGNLFVFINAVSYSFYLVLVKPLMKKYNPLTVITYVFSFGFVFMFPFGIKQMLETDFSTYTTNTYLVILYVIIGTTFLAYLFNIFALKHVRPSVSGSYIYVQPAVTFIIVSLYTYFLNDTTYSQDISGIKILSCLLVFSGVYLISRNKKETTKS